MAESRNPISIVWNPDRTEGFVTIFPEVAYEARKGAKYNCCNNEGVHSPLAVAFCDIWSGEHDCTRETFDRDNHFRITLPDGRGIAFVVEDYKDGFSVWHQAPDSAPREFCTGLGSFENAVRYIMDAMWSDKRILSHDGSA